MRKLIISIPILLFSGFLILNIINIFISPAFLFSKVYSRLYIEAGSPVPEANEFLTGGGQEGVFVTDISGIDTRKTGETAIIISINGKEYESVLSVADTIPPTAQPVRRYAARGDYLNANDFVTDVCDATEVLITYENEPDFNQTGWQNTVIKLTDEGGNTAYAAASVYVYGVTDLIEIEAGEAPVKLHPLDLISNYNLNNLISIEFDTDINLLDFTKPRTYEVMLLIEGRGTPVTIRVTDTSPPDFKVAPFTCALNNHIPADKFVTSINDASEVSISYKTQPDFSIEGFFGVTIDATDEYGNSAEKQTLLTVMKDEEPPVIEGETDKFIKTGSSVMYRANVTAHDNCDDYVALEVDSNAVNLNQAGVYPVIYSAADASGNTTVIEGSLTVMEAGMDEVIEMADEILLQIIKEKMTDAEKVRAVYNWIVFHVSYKNMSEKNSLVLGGYNAFKLGRGDCYTFYSASEILLTRLGFENMQITRLGGYTRHYWNLVNIGDGWYHFDPCPRTIYMDGCMFTETKAAEYTELRGNNYYFYDKTLYPEVVE